MSIHDLTIKEGIDTAKARLNAIAKKGGSVEIKEVKETRTSKQNRYLHKQWQILADEIGDFMEDVKFDSKIELGFYTETSSGNKKPKETSKLSTKDFAEFTDKFLMWAFTFHGVRLMKPEEFWRGEE
jgi:hypothetical protein